MKELHRIQFCQVSFRCVWAPFNVQDLLKVPLGIKAVAVQVLPSIKLDEVDATRRNLQSWDFLFCFNKGYDR